MAHLWALLCLPCSPSALRYAFIVILIHNVDVFVDYSFCLDYLFAWLITSPLRLSSLSAVSFWFLSVSTGLASDPSLIGLALALPLLNKGSLRMKAQGATGQSWWLLGQHVAASASSARL